MFQLAAHPQSIGKVLDGTFKLFAASIKSSFILALLAALAALLPAMIMQHRMGGDPTAFVQGGMGIFMLFYLIGVLISLVLYSALIYKVNSIALNQQVGYGQAVSVGLRKLLPLILAGILYILAVMVGSILLLVPGIILSVSLIFYVFLIVCDNQGPISALTASHKLVWGNWWRTITVFLAPFFVYLVIYIAAGMVIGVAAGIQASSGEMALSSINLYMNLLTLVISVVAYPFFASLMIVQVNDLKIRKSGDDLDARIAAA